VKDPVRARELVGRTALLEFKLLADVERTSSILTKLDQAIAGTDSVAADSMASDTTLADTLQTAKTASPAEGETLAQDTAKTDTGVTHAAELFGEDLAVAESDTTSSEYPLLSLLDGRTSDILVPSENRSKVVRYLNTREYRKLIPGDVEFLWGSKEADVFGDGKMYWRLYLVKKQSDLSGSKLSDARSTIGSGYDPAQAGKPVVTMDFTREGGRIFARVTGANVGKRLAIVLDEKVYMAPNIQDKISGGSAIITGLDDMAEARDIAIVLRAGALPAPVQVVEERTVGPSLGNDSVQAGKLSLILAFLAVTIFMLIYYRLSGGIADVAMILNVFLLLAILGMFHFTLTMPGIAGIILTIGMAVDANVLIFERIREELRLGKTVRASIDQGFARAIVTIIDANLTTAIAAIVLLIYGTGPIKGFALTLTIGISVNLFAAIVFTRMIYDMFTHRRQLNTLSI
jgi:protein-export membrane protein SecD